MKAEKAMNPIESSTGAERSLEEYFERMRRLVDASLDRYLPREDEPPDIVHRAMRYSVFAGGKRLRPILALATAETLTGSWEPAVEFACALEMLHTYSLIHDDLPAMDNDDFRRGRPTCHKQFGEAVAILAGNGLMTRAFWLLAGGTGETGAPARRLELIRRLCEAIGTPNGVIAGQVVDLLTQGRPYDAQQLRFIHEAKTAALIEISIWGAAILCDAPEETAGRLRRFGRKIGLAFQIVDDILDEVGDAAEVGKTLGKDRAQQKATYPALFGLEASREEARRLKDEAVAELADFGERARRLVQIAEFITARRY
ncbi:MAG: polyprenyl synthetase family protein [Acidobacteriota bacterium]